eukprot:jgi/Botrbrau1/21362/Bobra.0184s0068.1
MIRMKLDGVRELLYHTDRLLSVERARRVWLVITTIYSFLHIHIQYCGAEPALEPVSDVSFATQDAFPKATVAHAHYIPSEPFGLYGSPFDVFISNDPSYVRMPVTGDSGSALNVTRRPALCKGGNFQKVTSDSMTKVPAAAVGRFYVRFKNNSSKYCSAVQLNSTVILTATHCVWDCKTAESISAGIFLRQYNNGSYTASSAYKHSAAWRVCDKNQLYTYDFALVRLQTAIPLKGALYPVPVRCTANATAASKTAFMLSYPSQTVVGGNLWLSEKSPGTNVSFRSPSQLMMDISSEGGSSGGPLFLNRLPVPPFAATTAIVGVASFAGTSCPNGFAAFQPGKSPSDLMPSLPL